MNILVIGNGGREHAIIWKLHQSPLATRIYCAPGNAGTSTLATNVPLKSDDVAGIVAWAGKNSIDLCVIGPEAPLAAGLVDKLRDAGIPAFGPTAAAARLETSKAFAKEFMHRHHIPTAEFRVFNAYQLAAARDYLRTCSYPVVLKADGLAAGKGVVISQSYDEAGWLAEEMLKGAAFGDAGRILVVEEYLEGFEASVFAITDGTRFVTLAPAQDHKRIFDGDQGKNTGGMGAFAPTPLVTSEMMADVKIKVIKPVLDGMRDEGCPFTGVLFVGLMFTAKDPRVLEFNVRFGDPETQVILPLIDSDLAGLFMSVAKGRIDIARLPMHEANAVCVVMASNGYPDAYATGKEIRGLDTINEYEEGVVVFHAGTKKDGGNVVTAGGRVLGITALNEGYDLRETIALAYSVVNRIAFDGAYYRTDIGKKGILD
jgi:phosphoribosylamine--glycine ligase